MLCGCQGTIFSAGRPGCSQSCEKLSTKERLLSGESVIPVRAEGIYKWKKYVYYSLITSLQSYQTYQVTEVSAEWLNHDRVQIQLKGLRSLFWISLGTKEISLKALDDLPASTGRSSKGQPDVHHFGEKCIHSTQPKRHIASFQFDAWKRVNRKVIRLQLPVTDRRAAAGQWQSEMIPKLLRWSVDPWQV